MWGRQQNSGQWQFWFSCTRLTGSECMQRILENYANLLTSKWHESKLYPTDKGGQFFICREKQQCECVSSTNTLQDISSCLVKLARDRVDRVDTLETFIYPYYYDQIHMLIMDPYIIYTTPISDQLVESLSYSITLYGSLLCKNHICQ